jgi:hypothetical protein
LSAEDIRSGWMSMTVMAGTSGLVCVLQSLEPNLTWQLEQVIGSDVSVALSGCTAKLLGRVPSQVARQAVVDITIEIAPWLNSLNRRVHAAFRDIPVDFAACPPN